jgi:peptidoglycan/LPS O-acetylase OafA/YrhL
MAVATFLLVAGWASTHPLPGFHPLPMHVLMLIPVAFFLFASLLSLGLPPHRGPSPAFRRISIFLGGGSYALYVIHTPLLCLVAACVPDSLFRFITFVVLTAVAVVVLEYAVQPRLAALIDRVWKSA